MKRGWILWALGMALGVMALPVNGQLPRARLLSLKPLGVRVGSSAQVQARGADLDEPIGLWISHPGIEAQPLEERPGVFQVLVDPNTPVGFYEARVVGRYGVSAPRTFVVTRYPVVAGEATRTNRDTPQRIEIGTVVDATMAAETVDHYQFEARAKQKVIIEVVAQSIDSKMRPAISIRQGDAREFINSRIRERIMFVPPEGGLYEVYVSDHVYGGGEDHFYQLRVSTDPEARGVFPPVALTEEEDQYEVLGWNLPQPSKTIGTLEVATAPLTSFSAVALDGRRFSRDAPFSADLRLDGPQWTLPELNHAERTRTLLSAEPTMVEPEELDVVEIAIPVAIGGRFFPKKDRDQYEFEARAGSPIWIHMDAERLGEAVNPFGLLEEISGPDDTGRARTIKELYGMEGNVGGESFDTTTSDFHWRFDPPRTGRYRLTVWDLFNSHRDDPGLVYRLTLREPQPRFDLIALPIVANFDNRPREARQWPLFIRKGGAQSLRVIALREDGYDGSIDLAFLGLPETVTVTGALIPEGQNETIVTLRSDIDGVGWGGRVDLLGKASINGDLVRVKARFGVTLWDVPDTNNEAPQSRLSPHLYLGVSDEEAAPVRVRLATQTVIARVPESPKVEIEAAVERDAGFQAPLELTIRGPDALKGSQTLSLAPDQETGVLTLDAQQLELKPGRYPLQLHAITTGTYKAPGTETESERKYAIYTETIELVVEESEVDGQAKPSE